MNMRDYFATHSLMAFYLEESDKYYDAVCRSIEIENLLLTEKSVEEFDRLVKEKHELCEYIDFQKGFCAGILAAKDKLADYFGLDYDKEFQNGLSQ